MVLLKKSWDLSLEIHWKKKNVSCRCCCALGVWAKRADAQRQAQSSSVNADAWAEHTILVRSRARRLTARQRSPTSWARMDHVAGADWPCFAAAVVQDTRFQSSHRLGMDILHIAETARLTAPPAPPWQRAPPLGHVQAAAVCAAGRASGQKLHSTRAWGPASSICTDTYTSFTRTYATYRYKFCPET